MRAMKGVFGKIMLLITDYSSIFCRFNSFLSSCRFILLNNTCCSSTGVDIVFLTGYNFTVRPWVISISPLLKAILKYTIRFYSENNDKIKYFLPKDYGKLPCNDSRYLDGPQENILTYLSPIATE